jgi:hypothetical protein
MAKTMKNTGSQIEGKKKPYEKPVIMERSGMTFTKEIQEEFGGENHCSGRATCGCSDWEKREAMNYFKHLLANWMVSIRAVLLALFHFVHGVIPVKYTSHNYWDFFLHGKKEKKR